MKMLCSTIGILASVQYNSKYVSLKMPFEKMSHHKRHIYDILKLLAQYELIFDVFLNILMMEKIHGKVHI